MLRSLLHDTPLNPLSRGDFYLRELVREGKLNQAIDIIYYREDKESKQAIANTYTQFGLYNESRAKGQEIVATTPEEQKTIDFITKLADLNENSLFAESSITSTEESELFSFSAFIATEVYAQSALEFLNKEEYRRYPQRDMMGAARMTPNTEEFHWKVRIYKQQ